MNFEGPYISLRKKEGRLFSDEEVALLPFLPKGHPLSEEWQLRQDTCSRFLEYIGHLPKNSSVIEIGCGNGWFSARIAQAGELWVLGIDTNVTELEQAKRVFSAHKRLQFRAGSLDVLSDKELVRHMLAPTALKVELILLAGAVQYFPDLHVLMSELMTFLKEDGEIHILDSPFYKKEEVASAKKRSDEYYAQIGFPEMSVHYHHHSYDALNEFKPRFLYKPSPVNSFIGKLKGKPASPFPWIMIKKSVNLKG